MAYLIANDYLRQIQSSQLAQLTGGVDTLRTGYELSAQEEISSMLRQKYDITDLFTTTTAWVRATAYAGGARVYLDATAYAPASAYAVNDLCLQAGSVYICTAITTGTFDATKWTLIGAQYSLFYVTLPSNAFDLYATYAVGDIVYYEGHRYEALKASIDNTPDIQDGTYQNTPYKNVLPDSDDTAWEDLGAYTITAGTLPTDTTKWTAGDNRNQYFIMLMIDIVLYHLHSRIAPQNVPELRERRYAEAKAWLTATAQGDTNPDLPRIQPNVNGARIRWGSKVKSQTDY